jgi:hypothetical protein
MTDKKDTGVIRTPKFICSFPDLFVPTLGKNPKPNEKPKYKLTLLFPKGADLTALKEAAAKCARDKWGSDLPKKLKSPFLDAGQYDYEGYEAGMTFIRTSTVQAPGVVGTTKDPLTDKLKSLEPSDVYPGCIMHATIRPYWFDHPEGGKGVSFGLQNVQKLEEGTQIAGRRKPEDEFEAVDFDAAEGGETADKPAADSIFS